MVTDSRRSVQESCHRCGGFMVPVEIREANVVGWRCVMCGEHVDPLILEHRRHMRAAEEVKELAGKAGAGKTHLN